MESILLGLLASSPSAVVAITVTVLFLRYMRDDRIAWRETVTISLDNNTRGMNAQVVAMASQSDAMVAQAEAIRTLNATVMRLEQKSDDRRDKMDERRDRLDEKRDQMEDERRDQP